MKLLRLKVGGFGTLRGEFHFAPDRLTLLVDENERGKSTLLAAVAAALYGLEGDRRSHRVLTPLERWRPWEGGDYRVELELETEGQRLTVTRDFERGTVEVWNDRGQELTADFREGKDGYPVGKKLLGIDEQEFERCAFLGQGELDQVVPDEERARRDSTLHARLESAADSRSGDTNATEALGMLTEAAASYTCAELDTTIKVDTAVQRLETKYQLLGVEIAGLEHDLEQTKGPLEELARLSEEEAGTRDEIQRRERERRAARAVEIRARLRDDNDRQAELNRHMIEAEALMGLPLFPNTAEVELRATVARYIEAERHLESLAARQHEMEEERTRLETEVAGFAIYESYEAADADLLAVRAEEIRRLEREHDRLRDEFNASRDALAERGYAIDRVELLTTRFGALAEEEHDRLRTHPRRTLVLQNQIAAEERSCAQQAEALVAIDQRRKQRRGWSWLIAGIGIAGALAAAVAGALNPSLPWMFLLGAAGLVSLLGVVLFIPGSRVIRREREQFQWLLGKAEARLKEVREERAESDRRVESLAARLNYGSPDGLFREWADYGRLVEERGPVQHTQQQITAIEQQRLQLLENTVAMLERAGGGPPDPAYLEITAAGIRQLIAARQRLAEFDRGGTWVLDERDVAEAKVAEIRAEAQRILESTGLAYSPERPLPDHLDDLVLLSQSAARLSLLVDVLIPQAASVLMDERLRGDLEEQLATLTAESNGATAEPKSQAANGSAALWPPPAVDAATEPRSLTDYESEIQRLRGHLDQVGTQRNELRLQFEHHWRRCHEALIAKRAELETLERARARAQRFKRAVDLARQTIKDVALDTHRRWAEFLNQRAIEILRALGTGVEQLRFGEDLDFSVKLAGGAQVARGKAALQLSAGARDQLFLAVRLAISEFLSSGRTPLPLLVDDCFVTSDDERVRAGMKTLIELSSRHQVIVVTCHRHRYQTLAGLDGELYASRVHWLEAAGRAAG